MEIGRAREVTWGDMKVFLGLNEFTWGHMEVIWGLREVIWGLREVTWGLRKTLGVTKVFLALREVP